MGYFDGGTIQFDVWQEIMRRYSCGLLVSALCFEPLIF